MLDDDDDDGSCCWDDCVVLPRRSVYIDGMSAKNAEPGKILVGGVGQSVEIAFCLFTVEVRI